MQCARAASTSLGDVVASAGDLLARAADPDLVVVASPNRTHVPLALAALGAGLAVVVDVLGHLIDALHVRRREKDRTKPQSRS